MQPIYEIWNQSRDVVLQTASFERSPEVTLSHTMAPEDLVVASPRICLVSFGVETLDVDRCFSSAELVVGLQQHERCTHAAIFLDCRNFKDPNRWTLCRLGHSGRHHKIVRFLFAYPFFSSLVATCKTTVSLQAVCDRVGTDNPGHLLPPRKARLRQPKCCICVLIEITLWNHIISYHSIY